MDASARCAQRHVQHGALFGDIDFLAAKHGVDPLAQAGFFRQSKQELEGFVGDAVLRVIEEQADRFGRHALAAFRIGGKFPEMQRPGLFVVRCQGLPGRAFGEGFYGGFHESVACITFC